MMKTLRIDRKELRTILSLILVLALILAPMATLVYALPAAPTTYTVSFNMHGIGTQVEPQEEIEGGGHATAPDPAPASDDYTFSGWYTVDNSGNWSANPWEFDSDEVNDDITLHAGWLATITYHAKLDTATGSTPAAVIDKFVGQTFELADGSTLTDDDYFLIGWDTNPDATEPTYALEDDYTVTGNADLYGIWEAKKYVTYDINAVTDPDRATTSGAVTDTDAYRKGESVQAEENSFTYTLDGKNMVFQGWATTPSQRTNLIAPNATFAMGDESVTLYAIWATPCAINYDPGRGTGDGPGVVGYVEGDEYTLVGVPGGFTAPGSEKFIGWYVGDSTVLRDPGYKFTLTTDTAITAQWAEAWTITYTNGGGTGTLPAAKNVASGSSITLASGNDLHKNENLIFKNWKVEGEDVYYEAGETITPESNLTLVAQYDTKYTVKFENNGAGAQPADVILAGEGAVPWKSSYALVPETANLEFLGWYTDKHFEDESRFIFKNDPEYTSVSPTAVTADLTLYAKWSGGIPYYTNFVEITDISYFVPGETYLFAYCTPVAIDAKVIDMPSGSARLTFTGTDAASLAAAVEPYGGRTPEEMRHTISSFDGYVKTEQQGQGFDKCPGGSIYRAADAWWYNCCRGGVYSVGPFRTYVYDTYMTGAVTISFRADSQYVYKKGGEPPTYDDFIVEADLGADNGGIVEIHDFKIEKFDNTGDLGIVYVTIGDYTKRFELTGTKHNKNNTQTVVATVSGGQSSSGIGASLSGNNATIDKLTNAQVKAVAGEKGSDVRIDISGVDKSVNQITIPAQTVESVANTVNEGNGNKSLTLALPNATVTLDNDAFNAIKDQAEGDLKLVVDQPKQSTLQSAQRTALSEKDVKIVVDAYFVSGGKRLGNFKGGKVTVAIPYTPKADEDTSKLQAYYIDNSGNMTAYPTTWKDGNTYFDVDHFSHFVVLYEGAAEEEVPVDTSAFIDLKAGAWYMDAVKYCLENGYMKGINSTYFGGLLNTTRAEVATIIWRMEGCPAPAAAAKFTDIPQGKWYSDSVAWGTENGVLLGISDTEFAPDATITREQLTAMFYRYSNLKNKAAGNDGTALAKFKDASNVTAYAVDSMKWATSEGLVNGIGGNLLVPRDFTTRFQLATMIWKYRSL